LRLGNSQSVPEVPHGSVRHEQGRHSVQLYGGGLCASSGHLLSTTLLARPTRFELVTSAFGGASSANLASPHRARQNAAMRPASLVFSAYPAIVLRTAPCKNCGAECCRCAVRQEGTP